MSELPPQQPPSRPDDGRGLSGGAKWAIAVVAVVAAIVAFVALRGGDDEPSGERTAAGAATTATTPATATATVTQTVPTQTAPTQTTPTQTAPAPTAKTIRVVGGQPEGGAQTLVFEKGDEIRLRVVSDTADEVHVHGYDLKQDVTAGGEVEFEFEATLEGRFEVELEGAGTQLATLEVRP